MAALTRVGFEVELGSRLNARLPTGARGEIDALTAAAAREARDILAREEARGEPPAFVFTYHVYYKAPDLIGPAVARALNIPYVIAEASRAPKRARGAFAEAYALASQAIDHARLVFAFTENDRLALDALRPATQEIVDLKPFIDLASWPAAGVIVRGPHDPLRLLTVAMMRAGDKSESYRQLAQMLDALGARSWRLDIVGDGPLRADVAELFARFGDRVRLRGQIDDRALMSRLYSEADIFVWPGVNEAFGMVYLEAQAHGAPCVAAAHGGVPDVIRKNETGFIVAPDDPAALAAAIAKLHDDPQLYRRMRAAAADFISQERNLNRAAAIIASSLANVGAPIKSAAVA